MVKRVLLLFVFINALLCNSCTNTLDITAPYKDTTIVYGLLSPNDSIQYIKIYKAFLGEGDAYMFAQSSDSFYFKDVLIAQLLRIKTGSVTDTINLKRDTIQPLNTGIFATAPNIVYTTNQPLDLKSTYKLVIHNTLNGSVVTSQTEIPQNARLSSPTTVNLVIHLVSDPLFEVSWESGIHSKLYDVIMRFHYTNHLPGSSTETYIDWAMGEKLVKDENVPEELFIKKDKDAFYKYLGNKLSPPDSGNYRIAGKIEIILAAAASDYYYYQKINNATVGVNQSIPNITNITNGIGLFSSKNETSWLFDLDNPSYDYLIHGPYTSGLGFY